MNWLEIARREIGGSVGRPTANTAEGNPTAATAVLSGPAKQSTPSIGSNGSALPWQMLESEALRDEFEERAAIMEFDGGLTRVEAERLALKGRCPWPKKRS